MTIFLLAPRKSLSVPPAQAMACIDLTGTIIARVRQEEPTLKDSYTVYSVQGNEEVYRFDTQEEFFDRYANALANDVKTMTIQTV